MTDNYKRLYHPPFATQKCDSGYRVFDKHDSAVCRSQNQADALMICAALNNFFLTHEVEFDPLQQKTKIKTIFGEMIIDERRK